MIFPDKSFCLVIHLFTQEFVSVYQASTACKCRTSMQHGDWWYWLSSQPLQCSLGAALTVLLLLSLNWHWLVESGRTASYLCPWLETCFQWKVSKQLCTSAHQSEKHNRLKQQMRVLRVPARNGCYLEFDLEIPRTFGVWIRGTQIIPLPLTTLLSWASHLNFLSHSSFISKMGMINTQATVLV